MKGLHFIFTWTTFLFLFEPQHDVTESCSHDQVEHNNYLEKPLTGLWFPQVSSSKRIKRNNENYDRVYKPIRIEIIYAFDDHLLPQEQESLKSVLDRAVRKITNILSVIKFESPLLLTRDACLSIFQTGPNEGKCARIRNGYKGEFCLDNFKIPTEHLEGFVIYNKTDPDPIKVYFEDGPGLNDTDFVLYVTSQTTSLCNPFKSSAIAYSTYCQLDNTGRPVAGQVNFCPRTVKAQKFDKDLVYKTAIHELFHALGFSYKLYDKFRKCDIDGNCMPWPQPLLRPVDGVMRFVTDSVVREMKRHFNCSSVLDFGGPIEMVKGKASSHWDGLLMHSSIMGSKEQKPNVTLIDPISLALLEDSGWYKVNYSQADHFMWGKGQGCSFGLPDYCRRQKGFCSENVTGCHHLRLSKARCNVNVNSTFKCGVFAADQRSCFHPPLNLSSSSSTSEEIFSSSSRCFLSSLTTPHIADTTQELGMSLMTGRCYDRRCDNTSYSIRVEGGQWTECLPGSYIQLEDFEGQLECPHYEEICTEFSQSDPDIPDTISVASTSPLTTTVENIPGRQDPISDKDGNSAVHRFQPIVASIGIIMTILEYIF